MSSYNPAIKCVLIIQMQGTNTKCRYRHPRLCKYFSRFGHCKYGEGCAYSHVIENKNEKIAELEKKVNELKEEMKQLKIYLS